MIKGFKDSLDLLYQNAKKYYNHVAFVGVKNPSVLSYSQNHSLDKGELSKWLPKREILLQQSGVEENVRAMIKGFKDNLDLLYENAKFYYNHVAFITL